MWRVAQICLLPLLLIGCAAAAPVVPKPILIVTEWYDRGLLTSPWPLDLRLVAYDNGLVIAQRRSGDFGDVPEFVWQQMAPEEASALAAEAKAAGLENVAITGESAQIFPDSGFTAIEYWDAERSELVKLEASATPCRAWDRRAEDNWWTELRRATDPRFVTLCDRLLQLPLPAAKIWHPAEMTIVLIPGKGELDRIAGWPESWPKTWRKIDLYGSPSIEVCVPVGPEPDAFTAQFLDMGSAQWTPDATALRGPLSELWTPLAFASKVAMPAPITHWAPGPCSGGGYKSP